MSDGTRALKRAVLLPGPHPFLHAQIMAKHRREWPVLWDAIDRILAEEAV